LHAVEELIARDRLRDVLEQLAAGGQTRHVKARHHAAPLGQRPQRIDAAGELEFDVQPMLGAGTLAQQRQGQVMAGVQREHLLGAVERIAEHALELDAQRLDVRRQARARPRLGPQGQDPDDVGFGRVCDRPAFDPAAHVHRAFGAQRGVGTMHLRRDRARHCPGIVGLGPEPLAPDLVGKVIDDRQAVPDHRLAVPQHRNLAR